MKYFVFLIYNLCLFLVAVPRKSNTHDQRRKSDVPGSNPANANTIAATNANPPPKCSLITECEILIRTLLTRPTIT